MADDPNTGTATQSAAAPQSPLDAKFSSLEVRLTELEKRKPADVSPDAIKSAIASLPELKAMLADVVKTLPELKSLFQFLETSGKWFRPGG